MRDLWFGIQLRLNKLMMRTWGRYCRKLTRLQRVRDKTYTIAHTYSQLHTRLKITVINNEFPFHLFLRMFFISGLRWKKRIHKILLTFLHFFFVQFPPDSTVILGCYIYLPCWMRCTMENIYNTCEFCVSVLMKTILLPYEWSPGEWAFLQLSYKSSSPKQSTIRRWKKVSMIYVNILYIFFSVSTAAWFHLHFFLV